MKASEYHLSRQRVWGLTALLAITPILATLALRIKTKASFFTLMRDPSTIAHAAPYMGFLSQVGLFFWISAASICLFSGYILSKKQAEKRIQSFLLWAGLFSLILAIDEAFLIHDFLFPVILRTAEHPLLLGYGVALALLALKFKTIIKASYYPLLAASVAAFAGSLIIDRVPSQSEYRIFAEDGLKLLGIICWLMYFGDTAAAALTKSLAPIEHEANSSARVHVDGGAHSGHDGRFP